MFLTLRFATKRAAKRKIDLDLWHAAFSLQPSDFDTLMTNHQKEYWMKRFALALFLAATSTTAMSAESVNAKQLYDALSYHMTTTYACQSVLGTTEDFENAKSMMKDFLGQALDDDSATPESATAEIENRLKKSDVISKTKALFAKEKLNAEQQKGYCQALEVNSFRKVAFLVNPELMEKAKAAAAAQAKK